MCAPHGRIEHAEAEQEAFGCAGIGPSEVADLFEVLLQRRYDGVVDEVSDELLTGVVDTAALASARL